MENSRIWTSIWTKFIEYDKQLSFKLLTKKIHFFESFLKQSNLYLIQKGIPSFSKENSKFFRGLWKVPTLLHNFRKKVKYLYLIIKYWKLIGYFLNWLLMNQLRCGGGIVMKCVWWLPNIKVESVGTYGGHWPQHQHQHQFTWAIPTNLSSILRLW